MRASPSRLIGLVGALLVSSCGGGVANDGPNGNWFGWAVAGPGDLNGDGVPDMVVSASGTKLRGRIWVGQVFAFSGRDGSLLWQLDGSEERERFGFSLCSAGDFNRDGTNDVVVGAIIASPGGRESAGKVLVCSGKTGEVLRSFEGTGFKERLGWTSTPIGDVNKDGVPDYLLGAPGASPDGVNGAGLAKAVLGKDGSVLFSIQGSGNNEACGQSVAAVGDIDGDGTRDVAVGCMFHGSDIHGSGYVKFLSGKDGHVLRKLIGEYESDVFGEVMATVGDLNADGMPDLAVCAPGHGAPVLEGDKPGEVRVFSGRDGVLLFRLRGSDRSVLFGGSVAGIGDVNGDAIEDIAVGDPESNSGPDHRAMGSVHVYSGKDGSPLYEIPGRTPGEALGRSIAPLGDVTGDGTSDYVIGAPAYSSGTRNDYAPGRAYVVSGKDGSLIRTLMAPPRK